MCVCVTMSVADPDDPGPSSGMTLRKSTRILRKAVPALPFKAPAVKKATTPEHSYCKTPVQEMGVDVDPVNESGSAGPVEKLQDTSMSTRGSVDTGERGLIFDFL